MGTLTAPLDLKRYGRRLSKTVPRVITSEEEHGRTWARNCDRRISMGKGERNMSAEEDALLDLLTSLIRDYEASAYRSRPKCKPHEMVAFLLEQRGLKPSDLWIVLGSRSRVSEILAGKRAISKEQAKKLAAFFHVGVAVFI